MPRSDPDDPYRDDSKRHAPRPSADKGHGARKQRAKSGAGRKPAARKPAAKKAAPAKQQTQRNSAPQRDARGKRGQSTPAAEARKPRKRRSSKRGRGGGGSHRESQLTSHPTSRNAYVETRAWLLAEHGPVCAYCARSFTPRVMTLDHVAPRKGKTAYDRRDNLVLACPACNAAKRDLAPIAFLLGSRDRAANLLRYGTHLSPMLVEMARSLAPAGASAAPPAFGSWAALFDVDEEDPYR